MKSLLAVLLMSSASICSAQLAAPSNKVDPRRDILWLLDDFVPQDTLDSCVKLVMHPETAATKEELANARKQVGLIPGHVATLRKLVKPGTSIFDYPGLLRICRITNRVYDRHPDGAFDCGYQLYYGTIKGFDEFQTPPAVRIDFNDKGVITGLEDVIIEW